MSQATISISFPIDHPHLTEILGLVRGATGEDPGAVLDRLLSAELNDGEVLFLTTLAAAAPEVVPYEDLVALAGSYQKLGNITSGLFRRWKSRGGVDTTVPWADVKDTGRQMQAGDAALVMERLGSGAKEES